MYQATIIGEIETIRQVYGPGDVLNAHLGVIETFANNALDVCEECRKEGGEKND
jgi:hypothetical protein